jgi:hypothetical protein
MAKRVLNHLYDGTARAIAWTVLQTKLMRKEFRLRQRSNVIGRMIILLVMGLTSCAIAIGS